MGLAERELSAIGKQIHLQEKLDMGKLSPLPSGRKTKTKTNAKPSRGSAGVLEASPSRSPSAALKPSRTSLDNVGEREVKVAMHVQSTHAHAFANWFEMGGRWHSRQYLVGEWGLRSLIKTYIRVGGVK